MRFAYFRQNAHLLTRVLAWSMALHFAQFIAIIVLAIIGLSHEPRFAAVTPDLRIVELPALNTPYVSDDRVRTWAADCASGTMTLGFSDRRLRQEQSRKCFTGNGLSSLLQALQAVKFNETIESQFMNVRASVAGPVVITGQGINKNVVYTWLVEVPLVVDYQKGGKTTKRNVNVQLTIVRVSNFDNYAVAIDQWIGAPAEL